MATPSNDEQASLPPAPILPSADPDPSNAADSTLNFQLAPEELFARAAFVRAERRRSIMHRHENPARSSSRPVRRRPRLQTGRLLKHEPAPAAASSQAQLHLPRAEGLELDSAGDFEPMQFSSSAVHAVHGLIPEDSTLPSPPVSPRWDSLPSYYSAARSHRRPGVSSNPQSPVRSRGGGGVSGSSFSSELRPADPRDSDHSAPGYHDVPRTPVDPSSMSLLYDPYIRPSTVTGGSMAVENFSRPRKPSIKNSDPRLGDAKVAELAPADAFQNGRTMPYQGQYSPAYSQGALPRPRGHSSASAQTSTTLSSLRQRPSNDQLHSSRAASLRQANVVSPHQTSPMSRPPLAFLHDKLGGAASSQPGTDETRSSFRSQLTTSTTQGTLFTGRGTERSSILTNTSSITESLIINGYARTSRNSSMLDDGPSVDDVMRLYANGFGDDSDTEDIPNVSVDGHHFKHDKRNPSGSDVGGTPYPPPDVGNVGAKMLEAMSDMLPIPKATPTANSSPSVARDSVAMFRHSLPPSSLPQDGSLDLASLAISNKDEGALEPERSRHDSGKLVGADEEDSRTKQRSGSSDSTRQAAAEMEILSLSSSSSASAPSSSSTPGVQEAAPAASSQLPAAPIHAPMPQEPVEEPGSRDRYGFRKANAYITREQYDAWDKPYSEYLARRHKKWVAFLRENSLMTEQPNRFPQRSAKAKRFVRKGIPPNWRGAAWFYYAGGPAILAKHGGVYGHLVGRAGFDADTGDKVGEVESEVKPHVAEDIEKDLHRTFPDNVRFKPPLHAEADDSVSRSTGATPTEPSPRGFSTIGYVTEPKIIGSLRRVLYAFALYNPRIGYCQSLNFLAGLLLLFVESEEHAFWLLNVITRVYLPGTHETSLEGSKVDLGVLMESLKDSLPAVWKHIAAEDGMTGKRPKPKRGDRTPQGHDPNRLPAITLCMTAWFMSCFIGTLPIESVLRVWDVFFYEGSRTLFRISLAVFKLGEAEIRRCTDPMEMFTVVQALPRRLLDANALMEACYKRRNGIGHISQEAVEERRLEARTGIRRWKAEQEAAASGAPATPTTGATASGLDLAELPRSASEAVRRKGTLFGRRRERERDREQMRAAEVV